MPVQLRSFRDSIYFKHIKNSRLDARYVHLKFGKFSEKRREIRVTVTAGLSLLYFFRLPSTERSFIHLPLYVLLSILDGAS